MRFLAGCPQGARSISTMADRQEKETARTKRKPWRLFEPATPLVVTKRDRLARLLPAAREHCRGHNENFPGVLAADRDDHRVFDPEVAAGHAVPSAPGHEGVSSNTAVQGKRRSRQTATGINKNGPPQGPIKGDLYTLSGPQAPEQGKHVPEVGLEPTHLSIPHFECGASANSATRARSTPV